MHVGTYLVLVLDVQRTGQQIIPERSSGAYCSLWPTLFLRGSVGFSKKIRAVVASRKAGRHKKLLHGKIMGKPFASQINRGQIPRQYMNNLGSDPA